MPADKKVRSVSVLPNILVLVQPQRNPRVREQKNIPFFCGRLSNCPPQDAIGNVASILESWLAEG